MKRIVIFLSMLAMVFSFQETEAQSIRSIVKKKILKDNLEAQAKRDSARAVEEGREPDKSPNTTMNHVYMDALGLSGNVDYETSYSFDAYIQMKVSEFDKKGKPGEVMIYDSYVSKDAFDYAMEFKDKGDKSTIIFDDKNGAMLILSDSDGEKSGFAMGMDKEALKEAAEEGEAGDVSDSYKPYKTGKTKEILGYKCEEYLIDDETSEAHMWVSEELGKKVRKNMLSNQQTFGAAFYHASYMKGMVLEYDFLDKEDGDRVLMQVTDIDMNKAHSISTRSYAVMTMGQAKEE
jgi:hypothetical protein